MLCSFHHSGGIHSVSSGSGQPGGSQSIDTTEVTQSQQWRDDARSLDYDPAVDFSRWVSSDDVTRRFSWLSWFFSWRAWSMAVRCAILSS